MFDLKAIAIGGAFVTEPVVFKIYDPCATSLTSKSLVKKDILFGPTIVSYAKLDFFADAEPVRCPISSCSLLEPGCSLPYQDDKLEMASITDNYKISLKQGTKVSGQSSKACIICSNGV